VLIINCLFEILSLTLQYQKSLTAAQYIMYIHDHVALKLCYFATRMFMP